MEVYQYVIAVVAGFLAGIVNTLAGSGSLFTLPALLFLGLSPHYANGTNRVGILTQTLVGSYTLYKRGSFKVGKDVFFIIPVVCGSFIGAYIAVHIPEAILRITIGIVMLGLLILILLNYNELLRTADGKHSIINKAISYPVLFLIGLYGGFIQIGVGILALTALLLLLNLTFHHANALKNLLNFWLTLPAFLIFAWNGQIVWEVGLVVAAGQTFGAWLAARYASESSTAALWVRRLLVVMTLVTAIELLGIKDWIKSYL